ncbi:unnamed protein product [Paramecium pentaurelia]|uniref:Uncharacterized protein n=1 Tax=Paramecium pentaurelia TaxID=43138 RepID=A0A8S1YHA0_9CILI|nr:unnamed protein product [Paramecium pentaurelia]
MKRKIENSIQNSQIKEEQQVQNHRLHRIMLGSLEELKRHQTKYKERKELVIQELLDVGKDHFRQDIFSANYKKSIVNRKIWANDELV